LLELVLSEGLGGPRALPPLTNTLLLSSPDMAEKRTTNPVDTLPCTCWGLIAFFRGVHKKGALKEHRESACTPAKLEVQSLDAPPRDAAVVVDPYSSGKYLLVELEKRGMPIIVVRSSTKLSQQFLRSHVANSRFWVEMLEFEEFAGVPELVAALKALPYNIKGVFGGSEPGVELADHIANALAMPAANSLELLEARKDKAEMQDALRRNGVPAAEQFKSGSLQELLAWAQKRNEWPLVAKPTGGAGSDGVYFCRSLEDLKFAHSNIIGACNPTGKVNSEIALQEYLDGDEYIVDTVSSEGKHMLVAMWKYTKVKGVPWDDKAILPMQNVLLAPTGETQDRLVDYVFKVLDAVGLRYGPCHTEVMFTKRGPILVEVNARLHGLQGPRLIELATGISKATYAADVIVGNGDLFHKLYQEGRPGRYLYPRLKQCVQLVLISGEQGYLKTDIKEALTSLRLPSVVEVLPAVARGDFINRTRDLPTTAGSVLMVHESMEQIEADTAKIRELEESGKLYDVLHEPLASSQEVPPARSRAATLESVVSSQAGRVRLDSFEKMDALWAEMNSRPAS